jgi:sulfur carrier protein
MPIVVNGKPHELPMPPTLEGLLRSIEMKVPFAIALNEEFVPAAEYGRRVLGDGDRVEVVHPAAGG